MFNSGLHKGCPNLQIMQFFLTLFKTPLCQFYVNSMPISCQFYVKMPLLNLYFFKHGFDPRHHSPQHPVQGDRNHGLRVQLQRADGLQVLWQHLQGRDSIVAVADFLGNRLPFPPPPGPTEKSIVSAHFHNMDGFPRWFPLLNYLYKRGPDRHEICQQQKLMRYLPKWSKQSKGDMGYDFFCLKWIWGVDFWLVHNLLFVQYVFLPTKQAETYLKIYVLIYHSAYIYLSQLVRLEEKIGF